MAIAATANGGKPLIIAFTTPYCLACKYIDRTYEKLAAQQPDITLKRVDVDTNVEAILAFGIHSVPTLKVFKNGSEVKTLSGATQESLNALLRETLLL